MPTQCNAEQLEFSCVERRRVVAAFDGGTVSSDAGALAARAHGCGDRAARSAGRCFVDERDPCSIEHSVRTLLGQRVFGMALGYEDLNDHEQLRHDPVWGALLGKLESRRRRCAPLAGKSTLNRLERHPRTGTDRYHKIRPEAAAIEGLFVELFLESHRRAAGADRAGPRCHGRSAARSPGGALLSRLLRRLLLPAAVHLLRRGSAGGEAAAREHRCLGGRPGGGRAGHRSDPGALARRCASCCAATRALRARS